MNRCGSFLHFIPRVAAACAELTAHQFHTAHNTPSTAPTRQINPQQKPGRTLLGQTLRGIKAGVQGVNRAVAVVLPVPSGSIHGRVWWRTSAGVMHLGRDKKVWIIRRTVPRAAVLAALNHQPGLHAALVARIAQIPFLAAAYTKAAAELKADDNPKVRAWDRARATWAKAQAAWAAQNPVEDDRARAAKAETTLLAQNPGWAQMPWAKAVVAYDKARATWDKAHAPYDKAKAAYEKAQGRYHKALKIQFILAHLPPWIGTISAIKTIRTVSGLCGRSGYVARNSIMNGAIAGKTKADFKGRYHFSDIQAGQYFFILPSSGALTYGHLVALTYRHLVVDYGHPIMVAGGKNIRVDIDLNSAQPIIVRSAI